MCGRYTVHTPATQIVDAFAVQQQLFDPAPRYNVAPTQTVPVIRDDAEGVRSLEGFRWGLIPSWFKTITQRPQPINARDDGLATSGMFKRLLTGRRCLIPADGFYEWKVENGAKVPVHFRLAEGGLFAFAGLWDEWVGADGLPVRTCTIITTSANELVQPVHDRMPAILTRESAEEWLDGTVRTCEDLLPLLRQYPAELMKAITADPRVNVVKNDDPSLISFAEATA